MQLLQMTLIVEETEVDGKTKTGRTVRREIIWPVVPRIGEQIALAGNQHLVSDVVHDVNTGDIEISILSGTGDFNRLAEMDDWKLYS